VQHLDPVGIATRDLRECLLVQIAAQQREFELIYDRRKRSSSADETNDFDAEESLLNDEPAAETGDSHVNGLVADGNGFSQRASVFESAHSIVDKHLSLLQRRDPRELSKALGRSAEETQQAIDFIRTLDPRPGQRYNRADARLIEPDVAFVKRGDEYVVAMNEEDLPTLRLNQGYRRMITQDGTEKEVKDYVKERYRSAIQLMRNIEQRKNTILRTCEAIIRRQTDFLEKGVEAMKPMMIKEVAEEIGVHPSTVSRAVSNKYVHTPQGVYELRFFFSEGVNGPEGSSTPLMLLKRKVKKLIEDEDPRKPLTDDLIASMLQSQGIDVTRRTVAKYREDMRIPSTHQRRVRG
jgi:RNA polymerase sigma-54 factor